MDVLAEVLRAVRLQGTVYFRADFREPWGLDIQGGEFANFHIVAQGRCWLRTGPDAETRVLEQGDVVIFPHGDPHALLHAPGAVAVSASSLVGDGGGEPEGKTGCRVFGGEGAVTTTLICGHFAYDRRFPHPLFETLPAVVQVSSTAGGGDDWLATAGSLAAAESAVSRPGAGAVIDRLAEALLIQALLGHVNSMDPTEANSFLAAMQDRCIGQALNLIHEELARNWTLDELARAVGVSRSVFTERFRALVGESPMVYVARWRMLKARELLLTSPLTVAQVADVVGYQSEFSFSKAFKRTYGVSPGAARSEA